MNGDSVIRCQYCGGEVIEVSPVVFDNEYLGHFEFPEFHLDQCRECKHIFGRDYELRKAIDDEYERRIRAFLLEKHNPSTHRDEYYTAEEAAEILGEKRPITENIYPMILFKIVHDGKLLCLKESVEKMKKHRDDEEAGRETDHSYGMLKIF